MEDLRDDDVEIFGQGNSMKPFVVDIQRDGVRLIIECLENRNWLDLYPKVLPVEFRSSFDRKEKKKNG